MKKIEYDIEEQLTNMRTTAVDIAYAKGQVL